MYFDESRIDSDLGDLVPGLPGKLKIALVVIINFGGEILLDEHVWLDIVES